MAGLFRSPATASVPHISCHVATAPFGLVPAVEACNGVPPITGGATRLTPVVPNRRHAMPFIHSGTPLSPASNATHFAQGALSPAGGLALPA